MQFPQLSIFNNNPEVIDLEDGNLAANPVQGCNVDEYDVNNDVVCIETNNSNVFTVQNTVLESENTIVSYKDILGVATDLCRTVSEEQTLCKSVYVSSREWISKLKLPYNVDTDVRSKPHADVVTHNCTKEERL